MHRQEHVWSWPQHGIGEGAHQQPLVKLLPQVGSCRPWAVPHQYSWVFQVTPWIKWSSLSLHALQGHDSACSKGWCKIWWPQCHDDPVILDHSHWTAQHLLQWGWHKHTWRIESPPIPQVPPQPDYVLCWAKSDYQSHPCWEMQQWILLDPQCLCHLQETSYHFVLSWFHPEMHRPAQRQATFPEVQRGVQNSSLQTYIAHHIKIFQQMQSLKADGYNGIDLGTCISTVSLPTKKMMAALIIFGIIPESNPSSDNDKQEDCKIAANKKNPNLPRTTEIGNHERPGSPRGSSVICPATRPQLHWFTQSSHFQSE